MPACGVEKGCVVSADADSQVQVLQVTSFNRTQSNPLQNKIHFLDNHRQKISLGRPHGNSNCLSDCRKGEFLITWEVAFHHWARYCCGQSCKGDGVSCLLFKSMHTFLRSSWDVWVTRYKKKKPQTARRLCCDPSVTSRDGSALSHAFCMFTFYIEVRHESLFSFFHTTHTCKAAERTVGVSRCIDTVTQTQRPSWHHHEERRRIRGVFGCSFRIIRHFVVQR